MEVDTFDPIAHYLEHLPQWDGENHVARLFNRLPGVDSELTGYLAIWLRSVVAHWLQMDTIHGNECVPTLIGAHPAAQPELHGEEGHCGDSPHLLPQTRGGRAFAVDEL